MYFNAICENNILAKISESTVSVMFKNDTSCHSYPETSHIYNKTCLKRPSQKKTKLFFKTDYCIMQVKILQGFRPSFSVHLSLRPLFFYIFEWHINISKHSTFGLTLKTRSVFKRDIRPHCGICFRPISTALCYTGSSELGKYNWKLQCKHYSKWI